MNNRIRIKLGPNEFEAEGDSEFIQREREQFFSLLPQALTTLSPEVIDRVQIQQDAVDLNESERLSLPHVNQQKYESLGSMLKEKSFSSDVERVLGAAYFITQPENTANFTAKEIEAAFREARANKLSNVNASINRNISKGLLCEADEKKDGLKSFYITQDGIDWFLNYTPSANTEKKKSTTVRKIQNVKPSSLQDISLDELNLEKYPKISSLKKFKDQLFVVMLIYTTEKNIEFFTRNDLLNVMKNIFLVHTTVDQIDGVFRRAGTMFDTKKEKRIKSYKMLSGAKDAAEEIVKKEMSPEL